jgi:soluble lytic murein transglycosylase-like protein
VVITPTGRRIANAPTFDRLFQEQADRVGVPWELLKAIALQESDLSPRAVNAKETGGRRAIGLMQIVTPRGGPLGGPLGGAWGDRLAPSGGEQALFDPGFNIAVGADILAAMVSRYGLSRRAVTAYNDGRGNDKNPYGDSVLSIFEQLTGGRIA